MQVQIYFVVFTLIMSFLIGCGSQTLKDEGLESKSIEEAGSSSSNTSSEFKVESVDPADGATNISTQTISFTFNKTLSSYGAGSSNDCNDQLFYLSTDSNFGSCVGWNSSCSGFSSAHYKVTNNSKTISLCTTSLNSSTTYYLKVVSSSSGTTLSSSDGTNFTEFTSNFTTQ